MYTNSKERCLQRYVTLFFAIPLLTSLLCTNFLVRISQLLIIFRNRKYIVSAFKYHTYLSEKRKRKRKREEGRERRVLRILLFDGHAIARPIQRRSSLRDVIKSIGLFLELDRNANSRKSDRWKRRRDSKSAWTWQRASAFETESELNPYVLYALRKVCRQLGPIKPSLQFDSRGRHAWLSSLLSSFVKRTRVNTPFETIKGSLFHFELLRGTSHGLRDGGVCLFAAIRGFSIDIYIYIPLEFIVRRFIIEVERLFSFSQFSTINASFIPWCKNNLAISRRFRFTKLKLTMYQIKVKLVKDVISLFVSFF